MRGRFFSRWAGRLHQGPADDAARGAGDADYTLTVNGVERWYSVHAPPARPAGPLPVLFNFHGGLGHPDQQRRDSGMDAVADRHGFLVVYPAGSGRLPRRWLTFNGGVCCGYARAEGIDDVAFAEAVLEDLAARHSIDRRRVYGAGFSNGAFMCYRLAVERPRFFAAMGAVAGVLGVDPAPGADAPPLPLIHFHGLSDQNVAFHGGIGPRALDPQPRRSVEETLAIFRARNRCGDAPSREERIGRAVLRAWDPAPGGAPVQCWTLEDGGHTWPGGQSTLPEDVVGPVNRDIDASALIWDFVGRYRLPHPGTQVQG